MKRVALTAIIGLLLLASTAWSAQVNNVEVSYQDGLTVARIDINGSVRFTHQTEIPKDGRPDRVIVDILQATHELGGKTFLDLPQCIVTGVRTSQFSVQPEKVVRIVFDLKSTQMYKIISDENSVTITFDHKEPKSFASWSTSAVVAARAQSVPDARLATQTKAPAEKPQLAVVPKEKTPVQKNLAIESDRMTSLSDPSKSTPTTPKKVAVTTRDQSFSARNYSEAEAAPAKAEVKVEPVKTAVSKPVAPGQPAKVEPKTTVKASQPVPSPLPKDKSRTDLAKATTETVKTAKTPTPPATPKVVAQAKTETVKASVQPATPKVVAQAKTETVKAPAQPATPKVVAQAKTEAKAPAKVAKVDTKKQAAGDTAERTTARFRRAAGSAKVRGTMVAEFPKRLVIKYKTSGLRDPFASLIDAERTFDDPVGNRVPNVEGLKLVGVIDADAGTNRALFEDKNGFSYILKGGDKVRNGYVLRVESDQVYFQIFEYGWSRTVALTLE